MENIFLSQNIAKFNKVEMLQLYELVTYLAATKEITLDEAQQYIRFIFNKLE